MTAERRLHEGTRVRVEGAGDPVVLIHGVGLDLAMWDGVAAALSAHHRVIRYDMLGHGDSAKPAGPYRLADIVAQLAGIGDALGLAQFDLAGFSMGGLVAQGFAIKHPDRIRRMALLNTVYKRSAEERAAIAARVKDVGSGGFASSIDAAIERWFTPAFRATKPDVVESVRRHMFTNDLQAYANAYAVFATADAELEDVVAGIACPTLVMTGADDQRSTARMAEALAARIPRGTYEIIPGQRHLTPLEVPDRLAEACSAFFRAHRPESALAKTGALR